MNSSRKVLVIGWDAADWKVIQPLMDAGKMPNLQRLVDNGTMGRMTTLHPPLSPMLWTSIATGKRPFKHGILGFTELTADGLGIQPVTNLSRRCKAVWNILNQTGQRSIVVGWWPSHPAEPIRGVMVSDHYHRARGPLKDGWPLLPGCVHPPELHEPLADVRFHPDELVPTMIEPFIPRAREIDQNSDRRLAGFMTTLCECVSIHSAATWLIENQTWDFFAVYYDAIDHFSHGFMRYHPPRQEYIAEQDFEMYRHVVAMAYQFHDQMLGTLRNKAGEGVTVILLSDHGFHPDHLRPRAIPMIPAGPAIEHRDFGIFVIHGPGIKKDHLLHGACVLDITPTILTLCGLPVGDDMDGNVLVGAFEAPPEVQRIPSWEAVPGEDGRHPPHTRLDPVAARESLEQLVALGYIAKPDESWQQTVADTIAELRYNLAEAYQDADRHAEALEILRELHNTDPDEQRHAIHCFVSCQALGKLDEMREIVNDLDGRRRDLYTQSLTRLQELTELVRARSERQDEPETAEQSNERGEEKEEAILSEEEQAQLARWQNLSRFDPPVIDFLKAHVRALEGEHAEALELLQRVSDAHLARPAVFLQAARLFMRLRRWDEAEQTCSKALRIDPDNPQAYVGLCQLALRRRDFEGAAQAALDALQRQYHYPMAHFLLGAALVGLRQFVRAAEAFGTALSLNPNFPEAHLRLARVLRRHLGDRAGADRHFQLFRELKAGAANGTEPAPTAELPPAASPAMPPGLAPANESRPQSQADLADSVVVVSGLPRSGTSMVMQMLVAGGFPILSDGVRAADDDNPLGYFEYEPVKHLHEKADWLHEARGRAIKIVAPLLAYLPRDWDYRIIFIDRDVDEVLASQLQMLSRREAQVQVSPGRWNRLRESYARQVQNLKTTLIGRPRTRVLSLSYAEILSDPKGVAEALNSFFGGQLRTEAMAAQVKPALHRQRGADPAGTDKGTGADSGSRILTPYPPLGM